MGALDLAKDLLGSIPLTAILQGKAELLKTQIETMEARLKLADDRVNFAEEKSAHLETKIAAFRSEMAALREKVAMAGLNEEYERRGVFFYLKGDPNPRCPNCNSMLSVNGGSYKCTSCTWHYKEVPTLSVGTISFPR